MHEGLPRQYRMENRMRKRRKTYIGKKPNKMIVISWDAAGSQDIGLLKTLPHFRLLLERGAFCSRVKSVYPSLTYPAHVSIMTGKLPKHHGIVNNLRFQPGREKPDWFWQRRFIQGSTLYDEAEKAGLRVAALLWPVTAGARISYNFPEIWANRPWQHQLTVSMLYGTPGYELDLFRHYGSMLQGVRQPMLDDFVQSCMMRTMRLVRPDLLLVHLTDVDSMRHEHGVHSREAQEALRRLDMRLGQTMGLLKHMGEWKTTNLVILGDHYQKDVGCVLYPNYDIVQKGWAEKKGDAIAGWRVAAQNADGACYIYLKDRTDEDLKLAVARWLKEWKNTPGGGIREVYPGKRAWEKGADPGCSFMLEAEDGFYFRNGCTIPRQQAKKGNGIHRGAHGYDPDAPGYETFFLASGPDFQPQAQVDEMYLVDEGPILARALGLELPDADGAVINALFRGK